MAERIINNIKLPNGEVCKIGGLDGNITNCLLEVPQRIKYTLDNGTLTIHAGTVCIVPYGTEDLTVDYPVGSTFLNDNFKVYDTQFADGKFFVWTELQNDLSTNSSYTQTNLPLSLRLDGGNIVIGSTSGSGATTPTATTSHIAFYNTTENKCYQDGGTWNLITSPMMIVDRQTDIGISNVRQVFNGFGYIGSTVWVDKGVKGLIPNGRNEDGSLNNIEFTIPNISLQTHTSTYNSDIVIGISPGGYIGHLNVAAYSYDEINNRQYNAGNEWRLCLVGTATRTDTKISNFQPKQPFRAVDQQSLTECIAVVQTYQNGSSWYRVYSDGWCEQGGSVNSIVATPSITFLKPFKDDYFNILVTQGGSAQNALGVAGKSKTGFVWTTESVDRGAVWQASGYIT